MNFTDMLKSWRIGMFYRFRLAWQYHWQVVMKVDDIDGSSNSQPEAYDPSSGSTHPFLKAAGYINYGK